MNHFSRNYGIDRLRIVSMIGVVFLHILGHGGILDLAQSPAKFSVVWFLEILAFPAVNCFVLISGYVGYKGDRVFPKIRSLLSLWFTVLFYSITIFFLFMLLGPEPLGMKELLKSFMPTIMGRYWFFSAYLGLFLLSPLLNIVVHRSNFKQALVFSVVFLLFSIISVVHDTFSLLGGYSVLWFVLLYLMGAVIKKYNLNRFFSNTTWLLVVLSAFLITWFSKCILYFTKIPLLQNYSGFLVKYVSPTMVLMAIGLLCLFANIKCSSSISKFISFFASSAFSVYLIHDNYYVRKYWISNIYSFADGFNSVFLALFIIGSVIAIFVACVLIDKIRICLFRMIKIDKLSERMEEFIKAKIYAIYKTIKLELDKTAE